MCLVGVDYIARLIVYKSLDLLANSFFKNSVCPELALYLPEERIPTPSYLKKQEKKTRMFHVGHPSPVAPGGSGATSGPPTSGRPSFKLSVPESLDRVKEEFSYLQAQTTNLKRELEKITNEKAEIHRHYIMYYEMSYGLNVDCLLYTSPSPRD